MKPLLPLSLCILLLSILGVLSCEKDKDVINNRPTTVNKSPVAVAGPDRTIVLPKDSVVLNGSASYDPDGSIAQYSWTKVAGPASFTLANATSAQAYLQSLVQGVYQMELRVTDNDGASAKDTIQIMVTYNETGNQPPVANAGADQYIALPANSCTLNGSASFDPDGSLTAYTWKKVSGPFNATVENPAAAQTTLRNLDEGNYRFELKVTDNGGLTARDTVNITVYRESQTACEVSNRPQVTATLTLVGTLSQARMPAVAAAGNKIVFAGGPYYSGTYYNVSAAVDIYDITTGDWDRWQLSRAKEGIAAISYGSKIFFAGGGFFGASFDDVDIYDVNTKEWTTAQLSEPRAYMTAANVGTKVLFAGGLTHDAWESSKQVDIYDLSTNKWSTALLSEAKGELNAVTVGSKVYFAGGSNNGGPSGRIDIYDDSKSTDQWSTSSLQELKGQVWGVAVNNKIYWGGVVPQTNLGKAEVLNTTDNTVTTLGCLSYPRRYPVAVVKNNDIAFFPNGVWNNNDFAVLKNGFDIYNLSTGKWSIGVLDHQVEAAGIISVNNTLYMGGGRVDKFGCTDKVYTLSW